MIFLYTNHNNDFEICNLIKAFFFRAEIKVLKDREEFETLKRTEKNCDNRSIFIESFIRNGKAVSEVSIGERTERTEEDIEKTDILEDNELKREKISTRKSLYNVLERFTETPPKWGILTGVRPVKIYHTLREKGFSEEEIRKTLMREYRLEEEKAGLVMKIGSLERDIIYPLDKDRYSLYIGIPFCPTRCSYCSFTSNKYDEKKADKYIDYLEREMEEVSEMLSSGGKVLDTVYIGGGTPTALNNGQLERVLKKLRECFKGGYREFTVEAGRPDTIDYDKLKLMKDYGVDRISINPQSMSYDTLKRIDRDHSSEEIIDKYRMAKEIGFDSVNMDIIVGLPGEGAEEVEYTMEKISELRPENLTVHTMALKKISKISQHIEDYSFQEASEIEEMLDITKKYAYDLNLHPYYMYRQKQILGNFENIGYAAPGKECIYNIMMMEEKETIIALGVGSVSKFFYPDEDRIERVPNFKDLYVYFDRIEEAIDRKRVFAEEQ